MDRQDKRVFKNRVGIFIITSSILTGMFLFGYILNSNWFYIIFFGDRSDTFMDFFNSIGHAIGRDPYGVKAIYPPLSYILYWILGRAMGDNALESLEHGEARQFALRGLSQPMIVFAVYFIVSLAIFIYLAYRLIKGKKYEKVCFLILITISVPFMFQFERANIIFLSLLGTMAFFVWKDSENKYLKELALVCLAFSAGIKIYPAILGLVLVKEKRYKESFRLVFYGIICFFVPFLFIRGGWQNISHLINNLLYTSDFFKPLVGYNLSYSNSISYIAEKFLNNTLLIEQIGSKLSVGLVILSVCAFPWLKKTWKSILLLMCVLVSFPSISYIYTSIFFVIPLIFFLNEKDSITDSWIYFILFILIFFPLPFGREAYLEIEGYYAYNRSFNTIQSSFSILGMTVLLIREGLCNFIHLNTKHILKRQGALVIGLLGFLCLLFVGVKLGHSQAVLDKKENELVVEKVLKKEKVSFNGKQYKGVYNGETVDNKPSGEGVFTFSKKDGNLKLIGKWKNNSLNGNIKIVYPDETYELAFCENGQIYGSVMSYSESGILTDNEWYYHGQKLSSIKQSAIEADIVKEEFKDTKVFNPDIVRCEGEVTGVRQTDTFVEVTVKSPLKKEYLISYYNSVFGVQNQIKVPNLKEGDQVVCYGVLNGKDTKNILGVDMISSELVDTQGTDSEMPDNLYDDIMRYPYKHLDKTIDLEGSVTAITRDFESNRLIYTINENGDSYALVIGLGELLAIPHERPDEEKEQFVEKLEKSLPAVGESMKGIGIYRGNYIWREGKKKKYKLIPYIYTSVKINDNGKYVFE